jgi:hypothetical protein
MTTMEMTKIACVTREMAQIMKAAVIKSFVDEWMVLLRSMLISFFIMPNSTADATADKTPKIPPNPASKNVPFLPTPKSWM